MEIEYDKLKLRHGSPRIEYRFPVSTENTTASDGEIEPSPGGYYVDVVSTVGQRGRSHEPHNQTFIFQSKLFKSVGEAGAYVGEFMEHLPTHVTVPVSGAIVKEQS